MVKLETITDFLSQYGKIYIQGPEIRMRCPLCGDSKKSKLKKRFSVRYDGVLPYNCFNCGRSGTFAELYAELNGISISEALRAIDSPEFDNIKENLTKKIEKTVKVQIEKTTDLSDIRNDCIFANDTLTSLIEKEYQKELVKFIKNRQIPKEYEIMIAVKGEYRGRIIIPIYENGNIVYFQGRAINSDIIPKFKNPIVEKTGIIMNNEFFKQNKYIVVSEGIVDAMMIENNQGTCVLGGSVSDSFLGKLFQYTDKGIVIAVDNDERGKIERNKLITSSKFGKQLRYYIPPNPIKDINELKIKRCISNMYDEVVSNSKDYWTLLIHSNI